jgi:5'-nucleotidase
LVTNDDGIESAGIHVLAERLTEIGEVTVFAPSGEYSGAGAAIGHLAAGVPALPSLLACSGLLGEPPDIVVAGINPGWNVGHAVHFSGTIGACTTAGVFGIPAVAVSQHKGDGRPRQWATAAQAAVDQVPRAMSEGSLLNVNVPNIGLDETKGVVDTALSARIPYSMHSPTMTEVDSGRFSIDFQRWGAFESPQGSDTHAVLAGYVSVTPLTTTHAS